MKTHLKGSEEGKRKKWESISTGGQEMIFLHHPVPKENLFFENYIEGKKYFTEMFSDVLKENLLNSRMRKQAKKVKV